MPSSPPGFSVLVVCTANICRSPATAVLLSRQLAASEGGWGLPPGFFTIASAGTLAANGSRACDLSAALAGEWVARQYPSGPQVAEPFAAHRSRRLDAGIVGGADLVLALDRSHRAALAELAPAARPRTFTLRQAATLASAVADVVRSGRLPPGAPPLPASRPARLAWWREELDAARGLPNAPGGQPGDSAAAAVDPLDVPDPHVLGYQIHPMSAELIAEAVQTLVSALGEIVVAGR